jgi:hypothetical protein
VAAHPQRDRDRIAEGHVERVRLKMMVFALIDAAFAFAFGLAIPAASRPPQRQQCAIIACMALTISVISVVASSGLRRLTPAGRSLATIVSAFQLAILPFGPAFLYLDLRSLYSDKGRVLFASDYREKVRSTPGIAPESPPHEVEYWLGFAAAMLIGFFLAVFAMRWI